MPGAGKMYHGRTAVSVRFVFNISVSGRPFTCAYRNIIPGTYELAININRTEEPIKTDGIKFSVSRADVAAASAALFFSLLPAPCHLHLAASPNRKGFPPSYP